MTLVGRIETPGEGTRSFVSQFDDERSAENYFRTTANYMEGTLVEVLTIEEFLDGDTYELCTF